jgi:Mn-dependent DtxR family transcriptional regulator
MSKAASATPPAKASPALRGKPSSSRISDSAEDYLERIDALIRGKGYARVSDLAESLSLSLPSVSVMVKRLAERGLLERERYRGFRLTEEGRTISAEIRRRHETLTEFLTLLRVPEAVRDRDVEGLEHHLSPETLAIVERLVGHWKDRPETINSLWKGSGKSSTPASSK